MSDLTVDREKFRRLTLLLMVAVISIVFLFMIRGYLKAMFLAVVFSAMASPLYRWIREKVGGRRALASALTLVALILLVILPLSGFLGIVAAQAVELTENVIPWVQGKIKDPSSLHFTIPSWVPFQDKLEPYTKQIASKLGEAAGSIGRFLFNSVSAGTRGTATFFLNLFIMLYAIFFFLMQGESMRGSFLAYSPLSDEDKQRLLDKGISVARATIKGTLVIGIVQGALGGIAFAVVGTESTDWKPLASARTVHRRGHRPGVDPCRDLSALDRSHRSRNRPGCLVRGGRRIGGQRPATQAGGWRHRDAGSVDPVEHPRGLVHVRCRGSDHRTGHRRHLPDRLGDLRHHVPGDAAREEGR